MPSTRRRFLTGTATVAAAGLAGCATAGVFDRSTPEPPSYDHLRRAPTHVADGVDLTLPEVVPPADAPTDAVLVVVPDESDIDAATAVDWLTDGRGVALVGPNAQETFRRWQASDAGREAFESPGGSRADPLPDLLVGFAVGRNYVTTDRYTWGSDGAPDERDLLGALEESLAGEAEDGRPREGTATPRTATGGE